MLLTRSRLCPRASPGSSHHLHVLSTPPAFVLSQDQTLREKYLGFNPRRQSAAPLSQRVVMLTGRRVHKSATGMTGKSDHPGALARRMDRARTWSRPVDAVPRSHAAQFSKTAAPLRRDSRPSRMRREGDQRVYGEPAPSSGAEYRSRQQLRRGSAGYAKPREAPLARPAAPCRRALRGGRSSVSASSGSPSSLTPPCSIRRRASLRADLEGRGDQRRQVDRAVRPARPSSAPRSPRAPRARRRPG